MDVIKNPKFWIIVVIILVFSAVVVYFMLNPPVYHSKIVYVAQKINAYDDFPAIIDADNVTYLVDDNVSEEKWNKIKIGTAYLTMVNDNGIINQVIGESIQYPNNTKQDIGSSKLVA